MPIDTFSASFFTGMASISFAIVGFSGAYNVFAKIKKHDQEKRYLRSIFLVGGLIVISAMLPLIFEEYGRYIRICSLVIAVPALFIMGLILYEIITKKVAIQHMYIFVLLYAGSAAWLVLDIVNAVWIESIVVYKLAIIWMFIVHFYRFYLFLSHIIEMEEDT